MTAATIYEALSDVARVYTTAFGADNLDLPNNAFTPTPNVAWARLRIEHTGMGQGSLSDMAGQKIWDRSGVCTIECRTPLGEGLEAAYTMAEAVLRLYQDASTPSGVWFRRVRLIDDDSIVKQSPWYQIDIAFEFEYYQIS